MAGSAGGDISLEARKIDFRIGTGISAFPVGNGGLAVNIVSGG